MDADKQGFLRSSRSLIQTIGRCARNENGMVIMYADTTSESMEEAITETKRRRTIQNEYNIKNHIIPRTINKEIRELITNELETKKDVQIKEKYSKKEKQDMIIRLTNEMKDAAKKLDFEKAMELRDIIFELESE